MSFTELKRSEIKRYLLEKIDSDDPEFIAKTADSFGISVTSVKRYIQTECDLGNIMPSKSAECGYKLKFSKHTFRYSISDLSEYDDLIFYDDVFLSVQQLVDGCLVLCVRIVNHHDPLDILKAQGLFLQ